MKAIKVMMTGVLLCSHAAIAENPYVVGLSAAVDSAEGMSVTGLVDYSLSDETTITASAGVTNAEGDTSDFQTLEWDIELAHKFGPLGVDVSAGQWGDSDEFESVNGSIGLFRESGRWRSSVGYLVRDLEIMFRSTNAPSGRSRGEVQARGLRAGLSYAYESGAGIFLNARRYDYDQNIRRLDQIQIARLLSPSSLTLSGSLLDHSASVGIDWPYREHILSLTASRDRTAVDSRDVDSLAVGWLMPAGKQSDVEFGIGASRDDMDTQYFVSVLVLFYRGLD